MLRENREYDVVIVGAGLAGLSLARQLLLRSDKRILLLESRAEVPPRKQKVGESLVQVGGYYFSKVLDLEEHLLRHHFMKYNLRFYFKSSERSNQSFEDYGQAYIRNFSNVPCYQLDRNELERELIKLNSASPNFRLVTSARNVNVDLAEGDDDHLVSYEVDCRSVECATDWVVDTSGRRRMFARELDLHEASPIKHGSAFMWVDGTVDIERLTDCTLDEIRRNPARRETGHLPHWLATNHFMFEGGWFWVIPLRGKTSLGLVYDQRVLSHREVSSPSKLTDWVCEKFPLFSRDLRQREVCDFGAYKDFALGCKETISGRRWAMAGESGRFTDPLYSPGSDFIALHNSLIVDAVLTESRSQLKRKCWLYELLVQSLHNSLLPTYAKSYDALGDQEVFSLKYTFELANYFGVIFYGYMMLLDHGAEFIPPYLSRFSRLGILNDKLQSFLSGYYQWKLKCGRYISEPVFYDFTRLAPLQRAEQMFYRVGDSIDDAKEALDDQLLNLKELAKFIVSYVYARVLGDNRILDSASFVDSIEFRSLEFDVDRMQADWWRARYEPHADYHWELDPRAMDLFGDLSKSEQDLDRFVASE